MHVPSSRDSDRSFQGRTWCSRGGPGGRPMLSLNCLFLPGRQSSCSTLCRIRQDAYTIMQGEADGGAYTDANPRRRCLMTPDAAEQVQEQIDSMLAVISRLQLQDGVTQTVIPFLSIARSSKPTKTAHGVMTSSFGMVLQGRKTTQVGAKVIRYGPGNYVASLVDMPTCGQVVGATRDAPFIALKLAFDSAEICAVVLEAKLSVKPARGPELGAFVGIADVRLLAAVARLLKLVESPQEAAFLAPLYKREAIYRLLTGENGHLFCQKFVLDQHALGVGKAIEWLRKNFDQPLRVEHLARLSDMSTSSLHHKFKALTTVGPLQYQKQLRLQEARRLLLGGAADATTVALTVGYESPSQFSREYRRLFGLPP